MALTNPKFVCHNFTVIGGYFKYSIPFHFLNEIDGRIYANYYAEEKPSCKTLDEEVAFSRKVGFSPMMCRARLYKGLINIKIPEGE